MPTKIHEGVPQGFLEESLKKNLKIPWKKNPGKTYKGNPCRINENIVWEFYVNITKWTLGEIPGTMPKKSLEKSIKQCWETSMRKWMKKYCQKCIKKSREQSLEFMKKSRVELYENLRRNIIQISGGLIEGILERIHGRNPQTIQAERPRKIPEVTL